MVYRHSAVTRVTHATFFISFLGLALSGAQMYFKLHVIPFKVFALHQYLGLAMLVSGAVYVLSAILTGQLRSLLFTGDDIGGLFPMAAYYLRLRKTPPPYGAYNPLQKLAYTIVLLVIAPLIVATGFALWKHSPLQSPLAAVFGHKSAAIWHVGFAVELLFFFGGHMLMVATTGLRNNLGAIVTGWYRDSPALTPDPALRPRSRTGAAPERAPTIAR